MNTNKFLIYAVRFGMRMRKCGQSQLRRRKNYCSFFGEISKLIFNMLIFFKKKIETKCRLNVKANSYIYI